MVLRIHREKAIQVDNRRHTHTSQEEPNPQAHLRQDRQAPLAERPRQVTQADYPRQLLHQTRMLLPPTVGNLQPLSQGEHQAQAVATYYRLPP